ncbi:MAG: serine/threonine-protein kinase [Anaeromyxobacteraceae bacterium]
MIRMLGRYELLEQVGSGGMSVVYRGRDTALDREVAVKLLHPHLAGNADSRARFSREARAVARLSHPNIVEIHDFAGDEAAESYLVTEFVHGPTLRAYQRDVGFGHPEIGALVGRALADALVHAHSAGVIHRDLKPENVLVSTGPRPSVKLADFGIARIVASDERLTMTGALVGSPHHMAPEILEGKETDARSDLFSLGTLLYWLATGKLPFAAPNPTAILRRALQGDYEDPRAADAHVPDALAELIRRCLSVDPADRPGSAAEVRDALDRLLAECGLDDPPKDLLAFLRDPAGYKAAFPGRAVGALMARGDVALEAGATARAIALFNRVLAIDPENAEVPRKLARLARRRRARRVAGLGALGLAAAALVLGAWRMWPATPPRATPAAPPGVFLVPPSPDPGPAVPAFAEPAPSRPVASPRPAPAERAETFSLGVHVRPYAHRAVLDGVEIARDQQVVTFDLTSGRTHQVQIEHPCCSTYTRTLAPEDLAGLGGELRVSLEARPARVRVEGDPATKVYVEGRLVGTAGESQRLPLEVPIPAGGDSPYEAAAKILLERPGGGAREVPVRLRANVETTVVAAGEAAP